MVKNLLLIFSLALCACEQTTTPPDASWMLGPFLKSDANNPVLLPNAASTFFCPVRQDTVQWEEKDVFNPAAVVRNDTVFLLYRAEDTIGIYNGTSRIGLAMSMDGIHFDKLPEPVFYPDQDEFQAIEWEGGCEDPRIVEDDSGTYYMSYTSYDGDKARLCMATSTDLRNWTKHGSVFGKVQEGKYANIWSKSGSVVVKPQRSRLVAAKINDKYWMLFGESNIYAATSDNLIDWTPIPEPDPAKQVFDSLRGHEAFRVIFGPREQKFDSYLVESGPPAIMTDDGIVFIYNSRNDDTDGDPDFAPGAYSAGQVLLDSKNPFEVIDRTDTPFFVPDRPYEISGQVNNVSFLEGLVPFQGKWFLYYGTADSRIAVAISE